LGLRVSQRSFGEMELLQDDLILIVLGLEALHLVQGVGGFGIHGGPFVVLPEFLDRLLRFGHLFFGGGELALHEFLALDGPAVQLQGVLPLIDLRQGVGETGGEFGIVGGDLDIDQVAPAFLLRLDLAFEIENDADVFRIVPDVFGRKGFRNHAHLFGRQLQDIITFDHDGLGFQIGPPVARGVKTHQRLSLFHLDGGGGSVDGDGFIEDRGDEAENPHDHAGKQDDEFPALDDPPVFTKIEVVFQHAPAAPGVTIS